MHCGAHVVSVVLEYLCWYHVNFDRKDVVLQMQMIALRHRQDVITRVKQLEQSAVELARHGQPSLRTNINLLTMICILTEA